MLSSAKSLATIAAAAILSTSIGTGVASARKPVPQTGTKLPAAQVKRAVTTGRADAGSAGIPGFDDKKCRAILDQVLDLYHQSAEAGKRGDARREVSLAFAAEQKQRYLEDNCVVVLSG